MTRLLCFLWIVAATAPVAADDFQINGNRFTLPDGFVIEQIAGAPLVDRPVSGDFDELGRLYLTDSSGSNEPVEVQRVKRPHRIMRLVDKDGDGVFDSSTVFADKLMFPEGAMWYDGSLYVAAPPEIWKFTDTDDDGVADQREVWFDGKTLTHCANDLHGPYLGPDGWFYWCKGAFAEQTLAREGREPIKSKAAHIFRRHPKGGPVEYVMTGGMDNPVEIAFTPSGERIFTTTFLTHPNQGQRDGLIHAVYGGLYGKNHSVLDNHPRTGELLPALVHMGAAAPCGLTRLHSDGLGESYQNNLLCSSFNMHKITRHQLTRSGSTYKSKTTDLLVSDNLDFHPTDVFEDADGSVIIVDTGGWFRLCCPTSQLEKADVLGGVYRIRRVDAKPVNDPRGLNLLWERAATIELLQRLDDPRFAVQQRAIHLLSQRADALKPVRGIFMRSPLARSERFKLNFISVLTRINSDASRAQLRSLATRRQQSSIVRTAAMHSISLLRDKQVVPLIESGSRTRLGNGLGGRAGLGGPDGRRDYIMFPSGDYHFDRVTAEALGRVGSADEIPLLFGALANWPSRSREAPDRTLEHSIIYAAVEIGAADAIRSMLSHPSSRLRRAALIALDQLEGAGRLRPSDFEVYLHDSDVEMNEVAWWLLEQHPEWSDVAISALRPQLATPPTNAKALAVLRKRLSRFAEAEKLQQLMGKSLAEAKDDSQRLALLGAMLDSRLRPLPNGWRVQLTTQLDAADPIVRSALTVLNQSGAGKLNPAAAGKLKGVASDPERDAEIRLRALMMIPAAQRELTSATMDFLLGQLQLDVSVANRSLAVDVIKSSPAKKPLLIRVANALPQVGAMELRPLLDVFTKSKDPEVGQQLVSALNASPAAVTLFPEQVKAALVPFGESTLRRGQPLLQRIADQNQSKIERVNAVMELMPKADARRGLKVFQSARASCLACHRRGYLGGDIGPDLNRIGKIRSERDLLESILYPSLSFVRSYEPTSIQTKEGRVHSGLVRRETGAMLRLQLDAKRSLDIPKSEIETRRMGAVSIMPAGLDQQLTAQDLADLVKYLREQ